MGVTKNKLLRLIFPVMAVLIFFSCASNPGVCGKWQRIDDKGTIEFKKDGSFTGVDNMGAIFKGNYAISDENIEFEITHSNIMRETVTPEIFPEIINAKISIVDDELEFLYMLDTGEKLETERYRRESPCL